jgi:polyphosphate kinase
VFSDDKKRARIAVIQSILKAMDYEGKDQTCIGEIDAKICGDTKLRQQG